MLILAVEEPLVVNKSANQNPLLKLTEAVAIKNLGYILSKYPFKYEACLNIIHRQKK